MRVSPRELRTVRVGGMLTRYVLLGDAAFLVVEIPASGSAGTSLEEPCELEHWGIVLMGEVRLHGRQPRTFSAGTAFYVAPGRTHVLSATPSAVIAGFIPITEPVDESPEGLRSRGIEVMGRSSAPALPPTAIRVAGTRARSAVTGQVRTVSALMGRWLFTRSTFGPISGFGDGWCDLPHWGQVIDGTLLLRWESGEIELLVAGDVFSCPGGAGGHRMEVAESATMIDYTPIEAIRDRDLRRAPRAVSALRAIVAGGVLDHADGERRGVLPAGEDLPPVR
jgi:quercetin dioxygenase-like cupin family protein